MRTHSYAEISYPHVMINVSTTPLDLIILLHDSAVESLQRAIFYNNKGDEKEKTFHISNAMAIIEELLNSLDLSEGRDTALKLQRVYTYMLRELTIANIKDNVRLIKYIQEMLKDLERAWRLIQ